jgi:hypothetical protein
METEAAETCPGCEGSPQCLAISCGPSSEAQTGERSGHFGASRHGLEHGETLNRPAGRSSYSALHSPDQWTMCASPRGRILS